MGKRPRWGGDAPRDDEDRHCPSERGPVRDILDGIRPDKPRLPVFTLDDDEVVRVVLEGVSSRDHVCLESEAVLIAGRAVAPLFEWFTYREN